MSDPSQAPTAELKLYRRPMPFTWWLQNATYFRVVVRELTCIFVGLFAVLTLELVLALGRGPEAYAAFTARLDSAGYIAFSLVAFAAVVYHAVTFLERKSVG